MKEQNTRKYKPTTWTLLVSPILNKQTRNHIAKTKYDSLAQFIRTAVRNLLEQETPEAEGKTNPVFWILNVPPILDKRMRSMAKTNFTSMSDLIRVAVRKQLEREKSGKGDLRKC
jgi:Arc/MetJ-type ribon-helix-helix transcriptional regulator